MASSHGEGTGIPVSLGFRVYAAQAEPALRLPLHEAPMWAFLPGLPCGPHVALVSDAGIGSYRYAEEMLSWGRNAVSVGWGKLPRYARLGGGLTELVCLQHASRVRDASRKGMRGTWAPRANVLQGSMC